MRLYAYIAAALLAVAMLGYVAYLKHRADKVPDLEKTIAYEQASKLALQQAYDHERKISKKATDEHANTLAELEKARSATPTRSVRLCSSPTGWVPAPSATASGVGAADPAGRADGARRDLEAGPDIGPELYALADKWDRRAAQCNAAFKWIEDR